MIRRTLVPMDVSPPAPTATTAKPRRFSTALDSRTLIPQNLPVVPLAGGTAIPSHVPLGVLGERTVVPRDLPPRPLTPEEAVPAYMPLSILDARIVVPVGLPATKLEITEPIVVAQFSDVLEPDVITAGDVNLLPTPAEGRKPTWQLTSRVGSAVFHVFIIALLLAEPKLFPTRAPTQEELELARRQLGFVYLPPGVLDVPKVAPQPQPPSAHIRVDPRILRQVAPDVEPSPTPGPPQPENSRVQPELPNAPRPPVSAMRPQQQQAANRPPEQPRLEPAAPDKPPSNLALPQMSPGKALQQSLRGAMEDRGTTTEGFSDPIAPNPNVPGEGGDGGGGGGGGQGYLGGNLEMLTPTEGVDFTNYFARLLARVRRYWYAVIPESAKLGDKGRVVIQFHITRTGDVPFPEPLLVSTSGKEPLDRAAMSAIRASSPFEPLPPAFSGPYIELRFTFLYNLPLDYR